MKNKYRDEFFGSLHETAEGLHKIGVINDAEMREYDRNCLVQEDETVPAARRKPIIPSYAGQRT